MIKLTPQDFYENKKNAEEGTRTLKPKAYAPQAYMYTNSITSASLVLWTRSYGSSLLFQVKSLFLDSKCFVIQALETLNHQGVRGSNPRQRFRRPMCYHYTNPPLLQGRQELNPRRGALETPALPLSYGPLKVLIQ